MTFVRKHVSAGLWLALVATALATGPASAEICSGFGATNCRSSANVRIEGPPILRPALPEALTPQPPAIRKPALTLEDLRREDLGLDREYRPDPGYVDRKVPNFRPIDRSVKPRTRF